MTFASYGRSPRLTQSHRFSPTPSSKGGTCRSPTLTVGSVFHLVYGAGFSAYGCYFLHISTTVCETVLEKRPAGVPGGHIVLVEEHVKPFIWDFTQGGTDVLLYIDKNLGERAAELTSVKPSVCLSVWPGVGSCPVTESLAY